MSLAPKRSEPVLQARDLRFAHSVAAGEASFVLSVPALEVCAGEVLALCGPSGSGKSTLLAILAGLLPPQFGEVVFATAGEPVSLYGCPRRDWRRLRRDFGFVHQDPREYLNERRTVVDIVVDPLFIHGLPNGAATPNATPRAHAIATLQEVGITDEQSRRTPRTLSGGQRQRVAIARALVTRPRLLFLDEPTSALDLSVQASLIELLRALRRKDTGAAHVLVTHDLALARQLADRIAILDRGEIVALGEVDHVFHTASLPVTRVLTELDLGLRHDVSTRSS